MSSYGSTFGKWLLAALMLVTLMGLAMAKHGHGHHDPGNVDAAVPAGEHQQQQ